jgi:hypothetical protein
MIGGMMGVHVHPALKALIGVVLTVVGLSRHHAAAMVVLGIVVFVWGAIDWVVSARAPREEPDRP